MKLKDIIGYVIIIIVVVLVRSFIATPIKVNGDSMYPTLEDGDLMILKKYEKKDIDRFDIIVVDIKDDKIIKRVIGLPEEDVEFRDGKLYINDELVDENYSDDITRDFKDYCGKDEYFVMGDNRDESMDSRMIGCISIDSIMGKTDYVLYPFNKWGKVY